MKVLATDKMLATYLLIQIQDDFKDARPGNSVAYRCRDSRFHELLEHWLRCRYKDECTTVTPKGEFYRDGEFVLEVKEKGGHASFLISLLESKRVLVTLLKSELQGGKND